MEHARADNLHLAGAEHERSVHAQAPYALKFEWGAVGLQRLLPYSDAIVIVDVLSFTTAVDIALSRGALVFPYARRDASLMTFARQMGAVAAIPGAHNPGNLRLSPSSLLDMQPGERLALPSPNGATLSLMSGDVPTLAGCLRNAQAVAQAVGRLTQRDAGQGQAVTAGAGRVSVIAAGERWWEEDRLRPGLEDLLGAGAILARLSGSQSPEAEMAVAAFTHFQKRLEQTLMDSASGRELIAKGRAQDVRLAAELNVSRTAPVLAAGAYQPFDDLGKSGS